MNPEDIDKTTVDKGIDQLEAYLATARVRKTTGERLKTAHRNIGACVLRVGGFLVEGVIAGLGQFSGGYAYLQDEKLWQQKHARPAASPPPAAPEPVPQGDPLYNDAITDLYKTVEKALDTEPATFGQCTVFTSEEAVSPTGRVYVVYPSIEEDNVKQLYIINEHNGLPSPFVDPAVAGASRGGEVVHTYSLSEEAGRIILSSETDQAERIGDFHQVDCMTRDISESIDVVSRARGRHLGLD